MQNDTIQSAQFPHLNSIAAQTKGIVNWISCLCSSNVDEYHKCHSWGRRARVGRTQFAERNITFYCDSINYIVSLQWNATTRSANRPRWMDKIFMEFCVTMARILDLTLIQPLPHLANMHIVQLVVLEMTRAATSAQNRASRMVYIQLFKTFRISRDWSADWPQSNYCVLIECKCFPCFRFHIGLAMIVCVCLCTPCQCRLNST